MTNTFDQHGINHMLVALAQEMTPTGLGRHHEKDTMFVGGPAPDEHDQRALGAFGLAKNYKMIHATFDVAARSRGRRAATSCVRWIRSTSSHPTKSRMMARKEATTSSI